MFIRQACQFDFHKLTLTVLKTFHVKRKPKIIQYRDFNHFDNASFRADLCQELSLRNVMPGEFEKFNLNTKEKYLQRKNMLDVTNLSS